jgi:membrane protease YdiL (CAAX protease family)
VVLAASLLLSRVGVVLLEPVGLPVGVLVALLIVGGYGPPAWWCIRTVRRERGSAWRLSIGLSVRGIDIAWGLLTWLAAVVLQAVVLAILMGFDVPVASNASGLTDDSIPTWYLVATALAAVVAAPLVEELVFRGVVLASLTERLGAPGAVVVQGLIFGAVHADPLFGWSNLGLVLVLGSVGMVFGTAAHLTGRLGAAVIAHALFNGVVMVVLLTGFLPE